MKNSGASSSDAKGKRSLTQDELENLEKVAKESKRVKRIKQEAEMLGISYENYKVMVDEDANLFEKQTTEDEKLAKILSQFLKEEESILVNRQIKEDEKFAKALAQQEEDNLPQREKSIFAMSSEEEEVDEKEDPTVQPLRKRKRDVAGGSNMSGSSSDRTPNS